MRRSLGIVFKLLAASLAVGLLLSFLNVSPRSLLDRMVAVAVDSAQVAADFFGWAWTYVLIGAVVVIPVWLVLWLLRYLRGRR